MRKQYRLVTGDYVLDESVTFLRYNVGHATAVTAFNRIRAMVQQRIIDWLTVDEDISNYEFGFCHPFDRLKAASERQRRISFRRTIEILQFLRFTQDSG